MSLGMVLLILVGVVLALAIILTEWVRYERSRYAAGLEKKRRIFRRRAMPLRRR